jgi:hypothetical protein
MPLLLHTHLLADEEEVRGHGHHAALVGLLEELGRVLRGLGRQRVVVALVEAPRLDERTHHGGQRADLRLGVRQLVLVEQKRLRHKLVRDELEGRRLAAVRGARRLQKELEGQAGVVRGQRRQHLVHELEDLAAAVLQRRLLWRRRRGLRRGRRLSLPASR